MAEIVKQRGRRTDIAKQRYLPQATTIANEARERLIELCGDQSWIPQVAEAICAAVHNGISMFSSGTPSNSMSLADGDGYRFHARSKDELIRDSHLVAGAGTTDADADFEQLEDPATTREKTDGERSNRGQHDGPMPWLL